MFKKKQMCPHVSKEDRCVYFNTNWNIYLINGCVTNSPSVMFGLCASSFCCVHVGRDFWMTSLLQNTRARFRTFQCDNQGRRMDEHHSRWIRTRVFCTSAFPHVNELKSAIKDENAGKHPDVRVFFKVSRLRESTGG